MTAAVEARRAGEVLVRVDVAGTVLFGVTAVLTATVFTTPLQWVAAITALVLFAIGVFSFLWSYWNGVQRSRQDEISVLGLYFLAGRVAPSRVRNVMVGALLAQVALAVVTAFLRLDGPDGKPGSSLALGFLVPMFGFGMNGLWAAYHGRFASRQPPSAQPLA
ncbi:MAG: hypothetical protein ACR2HQ_15180 [Ilumatobacteraceae bacterium]